MTGAPKGPLAGDSPADPKRGHPVWWGVCGLCPRCGRGRLFQRYLKIVDCCPDCGLGFAGHDVGDGPVVPATFILGGIVVGLALATEMVFAPPFWLHAMLWLPLVVGGTLLILPPLKGMAVGLQYRFRSTEEPTKPGGH